MYLRSSYVFEPGWLAEPQLRLGPDESGITTSGAASGLVPAVMINNALLRQVCDCCGAKVTFALVIHALYVQHFRQLTLQFLKVFNRYFHVDTAQIAACLTEGSIGLYDDLFVHFLPKFNEEVLACLCCVSALPCAYLCLLAGVLHHSES